MAKASLVALFTLSASQWPPTYEGPQHCPHQAAGQTAAALAQILSSSRVKCLVNGDIQYLFPTKLETLKCCFLSNLNTFIGNFWTEYDFFCLQFHISIDFDNFDEFY